MHAGRRASICRRQTGSASSRTKASVDALWQNYFGKPIDWWDNRTNKLHPKSPDFRHKSTNEALWIGNLSTPEWVTQMLKRKTPCRTAGRGSFQGRAGSDETAVDLQSSQRNQNSRTDLICQQAKCGQGRMDRRTYEEMRKDRVKPSSRTFLARLKACSSLQDLETAKRIHADVVTSGLESDLYVSTMLVDVYIKCRSLVDARHVFEQMPRRDVVSWTAMIFGYAQADEGEVALQLCAQMRQEGVVPNQRTYVSILKACSALAETGEKQGCLETVRSIHSDVLKAQFDSDVFVGNMLVDAYAKSGSLEDARLVFEKLPCRDVVSWNAMIMGYTQMDQGEEALTLYTRMQNEGVVPNGRTFVTALKACSTLAESELVEKNKKCLEGVRCIHAQVLKVQSNTDLLMGNMLIDLYSKCKSLEDARSVFEKIPCRDVVSWNAMISSYARMDKCEDALKLYTRMKQEGLVPNDRTFVSALKACSSVLKACSAGADLGEQNKDGDIAVKERCLDMVRDIHRDVLKGKLELDVFVGTMLVDVYSKCGDLEDARQVFEKMSYRDVVSWNAMILGYAKMDMGEEALQLYTQMKSEAVVPDGRTYVSVLMACTSLGELDGGEYAEGMATKPRCLDTVRAVHTDVRGGKFEFDVFVGNMLVDAYAKCRNLVDARNVFDKMPCRNVVSWTVMILGYAQMDRGDEALGLYARMQDEGVAPDARTYLSALKACSSLAESEERTEGDAIAVNERCLGIVRAIHADIVKKELEINVFLETMLVDVYAKCGRLEDARHVFDKMPQHTVVSWTAMIFGYAQIDEGEVALHLYAQMQQKGVVPNSWTFVSALTACGSVAELEKGKEIHAQIVSAGLEATDSFVTHSLIDMYGKCGSMVDAQQVFDGMPTKEVVAWNALIAGYAHQGESDVVFDLFSRMKEEGIQPNSITFLGLLSACSHVGLVERGQGYFKAMSRDYGILPTIRHFTCMIDLLGRAGHLERAMEMVNTMPFEPNGTVWRCMLGACQKWVDVPLGRHAFKYAVALEKDDAAAYVLMSNIYAAARMQEAAQEMQAMRVKSQAWKPPGRTRWTDVSGTAHVFAVGDQGNAESHDMYAKLKDLLFNMDDDSSAGLADKACRLLT